MAGRQTADIVFCMDASGSMSNAFDGVRNNVMKLIESIKTDLQNHWDVRFDFLAYSNTHGAMRLQTLNYDGKEVIDGLYHTVTDPNGGKTGGDFFTTDVKKFKNRLSTIEVGCCEASGLALDIAADFPWRDASTCHRTVILLTDEAIATGQYERETKAKVMDLAKKFQDKKIALYMVTPDCDVFDTLSQIDKCEWTIDTSEGLTNVDFTKLMQGIGKSVSVSQTSAAAKNAAMPLFNESAWRTHGGNEVWIEL